MIHSSSKNTKQTFNLITCPQQTFISTQQNQRRVYHNKSKSQCRSQYTSLMSQRNIFENVNSQILEIESVKLPCSKVLSPFDKYKKLSNSNGKRIRTQINKISPGRQQSKLPEECINITLNQNHLVGQQTYRSNDNPSQKYGKRRGIQRKIILPSSRRLNTEKIVRNKKINLSPIQKSLAVTRKKSKSLPFNCQINKIVGRNINKSIKTSLYSSLSVNKMEDQTDNYLYRQGLLREIVYNQDLKQRFGERYFELSLRNRYLDEITPSPFIYAIKNEQNIRNRPNKLLQKIKKKYPQIVMRKKLIVKGHSNKAIQDKLAQSPEHYSIDSS